MSKYADVGVFVAFGGAWIVDRGSVVLGFMLMILGCIPALFVLRNHLKSGR